MKIYTKTGDDGTTALLNGTRVPKYHIRIDSYGTIDELSSYLGLIRDFPKVDKHTIEAIIEIQERLMTASAILASEVGIKSANIPEIFNSDIEFLEKEMDQMDDNLPRLTSFVLTGGHTIVSQTHIARCVCRRAERLSILVQEEYGGCENVVQYLNRLSDYLFILARKFSIDFKAKEIIWKPRL